MHGVTMIFLFIIPMTTGAFGNYLVPLMIGARDMAFPRLNALTLLALPRLRALHLRRACPRPRRRTRAGSTTCRSRSTQYDPGPQHRLLRARADLQRHLVDRRRRSTSSSRSSSCARRACRCNRMPLFCFAILAASLRAALRAAGADRRPASSSSSQRKLGFHFFDVAHGGDAAALAAPLLDLRPPRGLHHRPARVRDRDVDHPDVRAAPDGRVPARRDGRAARRVHRLRRLGAPHVRDRASRRRRSSSSRRASMIVVIPSTIQIFAWMMTVVTGTAALQDAAALHRRLHRLLRPRRPDRDHVRRDPVRPGS